MEDKEVANTEEEMLKNASKKLGDASFQRVRSFVRKLFEFGDKKTAVIIDGPNILRRINGKRISLEELREKVEEFGRITQSKAIVSKETPASLLQALTNSGFETIVSSGKVQIRMALEIVKLLNETEVDVLVIVSRNAECVPLVQKVKEKGVKSVAMGFNPGFSSALLNTADEVVLLKLRNV